MEWFKELRLLLLAIMILVSPAGILAGDLEPPSSPEPTMVSLQEISQKNSELSAKVDELIALYESLTNKPKRLSFFVVDGAWLDNPSRP